MINRWFILAVSFFLLAWAGVVAQAIATRPASNPEPIAQSKTEPQSPAKKSKPAPQATATTPPPPAPTPTSPAQPQPAPQPDPPPIRQAQGGVPAGGVAPAPVQSKPEPKIYGDGDGAVTPLMPPHQLIVALEQDKNHYPVQIWCTSKDTCAAKVVRKVKDTRWTYGLFMNDEVYYQQNRKLAGLGWDFGNGQAFTDGNGVVLHQVVWLKNQ
jgi:hypothetical protein